MRVPSAARSCITRPPPAQPRSGRFLTRMRSTAHRASRPCCIIRVQDASRFPSMRQRWALRVSGDGSATGRRLLSHQAGAATGRVRAKRPPFCAACRRLRLLPIALAGACAGLRWLTARSALLPDLSLSPCKRKARCIYRTLVLLWACCVMHVNSRCRAGVKEDPKVQGFGQRSR